MKTVQPRMNSFFIGFITSILFVLTMAFIPGVGGPCYIDHCENSFSLILSIIIFGFISFYIFSRTKTYQLICQKISIKQIIIFFILGYVGVPILLAFLFYVYIILSFTIGGAKIEIL